MKALQNLLDAFKSANAKIHRVINPVAASVHRRNELIAKLEMPGVKPPKVTIKGKPRSERPADKDVKNVSVVLGPYHNSNVVWKYNDEQFVSFQTMGSIVMNDPLFYVNYVMNKLTEEDRKRYPSFFYSCRVAYTELAAANVVTPLKVFVSEDGETNGYGLLVSVGDVYGMLIVSADDGLLLIRDSAGFEIDWEGMDEYAEVQFMRYSPEALEKMGLAKKQPGLDANTVVVDFNSIT